MCNCYKNKKTKAYAKILAFHYEKLTKEKTVIVETNPNEFTFEVSKHHLISTRHNVEIEGDREVYTLR